MKKLIMVVFLATVSVCALASDAPRYARFDMTFFGDDFSEAFRTNLSAGKVNGYGYLVMAGASRITATDNDGATDDGVFINLSKYYSKQARLRSRVYWYRESGVLGQATLFGQFENGFGYYGQCQREIVDNSIGIKQGIHYHGCDASLEKSIGDSGIAVGSYRFKFSDENEKDGVYAKVYHDVNEHFRISYTDRKDSFDFDTDSYFSPQSWKQRYAMIRLANEYESGFTHNLGIGYGEERIRGFERNPVYVEYNAYYDADRFSLFAKVDSRLSADYKFVWVSIGVTKKF